MAPRRAPCRGGPAGRRSRPRSAGVAIVLAGAWSLLVSSGVAPLEAADAASKPSAQIPTLFDPDRPLAKPDLNVVKSIRFLTTDDFPPFHFTLPDGTLTGFDIDLARAICNDLKLACTMQARRFDQLIEQIAAGKDDALIAAVADTPATRTSLQFTAPYYTTPARFVTTTSSKLGGETSALTLAALAGHTIGVQSGTAHEAYLKTFFPGVVLKTFPDQAALRAALKANKVDAIFGDAIALALWINGTDSERCCAFRGGPFTESRFFGNGVSIAVGKNNAALRDALDYELAELERNGTFADLYLKYFPVGFY